MSNYYVSPSGSNDNSGTFSAPWQTLTYALPKLSPGDTLYVHGGIYQEAIDFNKSGTASNVITVQAYENEQPWIDGYYTLPGGIDWRDGYNGSQYLTLAIIRGNYIIWDGVNVRNSAGQGLVTTGHHVILKNCMINNCYSQGIMIQHGNNSVIDNVICHDVCLSNHPDYAAFASSFWGFGIAIVDCSGSEVRNSTMYNGWGEGIGVLRVSNTAVRQCISYDNWAALIYVDNVDNVVIERNLCYWTGTIGAGAAEGINISQEPYGNPPTAPIPTKNVIVRNNIVVAAPRGNMCISGDNTVQQPFGIKNILIENNTFVNAPDNALRFAWFNDANSTYGTFRNNIILQDNGNFVFGAEYQKVEFANNLWSSAPPTPLDGSNSQIGDPGLENPYAPRLQGEVNPNWYKPKSTSIAINNGLDSTSVTDDFDNNQRISPYDIGAFEFDGTPVPLVRADLNVPENERSGPKPHIVQFDSASSTADLGISSYLWDFGDNTQSDEANPTHEYTEVGTYSVSLTITDAQGNQNSIPKVNYINVLPITVDPPGTHMPLVYYRFEEGAGNVVKDISGIEPALDLTISNPSAVQWLEKGLKINATALLKTSTPLQKFVGACITNNALSVEVWVKPANVTQDGSARIVSISKDIYNRNFTLGQGGAPDTSPSDFLKARLRTTATNLNGEPAVTTLSGSLTDKLQHIVYTRNQDGTAKIYIDNQLISQGSVTGTLNWDLSYHLTVANEYTGDRSWVGELHMIALYAEAISEEYIAASFAKGPHPSDQTVELNPDFTSGAGEEVGQKPHEVNFDGSASSATHEIVTYKWNFGDGAAGEGLQVVHLYQNAGRYTVSLKIEDDQGNTNTLVKEQFIQVTAPEQEKTVVRVTDGLQVLYTFLEGTGNKVTDVSGVGEPLDLLIEDDTAVEWLPGGISIKQPVMIKSETLAQKVIDACRVTDEITVEAWLQTTRENQTGSARIVSISKNLAERYVTLAQGLWGKQPGDLFDVRLRREANKKNGVPSFSTDSGTVTTELMHVVFTRDKVGDANIYLDGSLHKSKQMIGDFSTWDNGYYNLMLVNENTGGRHWLGDLRLVAIYDKALNPAEVQQNYQSGTLTTPPIPATFRRFLLVHQDYNSAGNTTNLIAYGVQYLDLQCALIWDGNDDFEISDNINAVTTQYNNAELVWID